MKAQNIQVESVLGIVLIKNKILLTKRRDIPVWVLPGGKIDNNETPERAIVREVLEETGFKTRIVRKAALYTSPSIFIKPVYVYLLSGDIQSLDGYDRKEVKQLQLFSLNALPKNLAPLYSQWIKQCIKNPTYEHIEITPFSKIDMIRYFLLHPIISIRFLLMKTGIHLNW